VEFADVILPGAIIPELTACDRDGVVREMVQRLGGCLKLGSETVVSVAEAVIQREREGSTAFGKGVAVPHARHSSIEGVVGALARSSHGVDFRALDRKPVNLFVLLVSSPTSQDEHLAALEHVFRILRDGKLRRFMMQAKDVTEFRDLMVEADAMLGG